MAAKADVKANVKARARATAAEAKARARDKVTAVSGRVRRSQAVQRRWPVPAAACVLIAGAVAIWQWKKQA